MSAFGMPWGGRKKRGLRAWVVMILGRSPKTGAEIMDEMERMSGGWWRPSPGSVYPLLEELTTEGVARKKDDGRYELISRDHDTAGWPFVPMGPRAPADVVKEIDSLVAFLEDLRRADAVRFGEAQEALRGVSERLMKLAR
jgi:hypothetical protein